MEPCHNNTIGVHEADVKDGSIGRHTPSDEVLAIGIVNTATVVAKVKGAIITHNVVRELHP